MEIVSAVNSLPGLSERVQKLIVSEVMARPQAARGAVANALARALVVSIL